jgi:hypothetical protein
MVVRSGVSTYREVTTARVMSGLLSKVTEELAKVSTHLFTIGYLYKQLQQLVEITVSEAAKATLINVLQTGSWIVRRL